MGFRRRGTNLRPAPPDERDPMRTENSAEAWVNPRTAVKQGFKARNWPSHQGEAELADPSDTSPRG